MSLSGIRCITRVEHAHGEGVLCVVNLSEMQSTAGQGAESCRLCLESGGVTVLPGFGWGVDYKMLSREQE